MERASTPAVAADAAAVTEVVAALESSLYGPTTFSQADLENEWSELDVEEARVEASGSVTRPSSPVPQSKLPDPPSR